MLSQQELSDRFEIQDLCYRYAQIIDSKDFDALRTEVFTEDAHIDYSVFGGSVGGLEETIEFLKQAMTSEVFPAHQHLNANLQLELDGDEVQIHRGEGGGEHRQERPPKRVAWKELGRPCGRLDR